MGALPGQTNPFSSLLAQQPQKTAIMIDDHPLMCAAVELMLRERGWRFYSAGSAADGLTLLQSTAWHLLILDLHLPDKNGMDVLVEIRSAGCSQPILLHSAAPDEMAASLAFKKGASGYLNKGCTAQELDQAIDSVMLGQRYASPAFARAVADQLASGQPMLPHEKLSDQELKMLQCLALGDANARIAEKLQVKTSTLSTYRARLLQKLQLKTTADLILYATRHLGKF